MAIQAIRRSDTSFEVIACDTFTAADVSRIVAALARRPRGAVAVVDLRRVRSCEPPALAALSRFLVEESVPYVLLGLSISDRRLLRYLEPADAAGSPA
jgi:hypothetical protein